MRASNSFVIKIIASNKSLKFNGVRLQDTVKQYMYNALNFLDAVQPFNKEAYKKKAEGGSPPLVAPQREYDDDGNLINGEEMEVYDEAMSEQERQKAANRRELLKVNKLRKRVRGTFLFAAIL